MQDDKRLWVWMIAVMVIMQLGIALDHWVNYVIAEAPLAQSPEVQEFSRWAIPVHRSIR